MSAAPKKKAPSSGSGEAGGGAADRFTELSYEEARESLIETVRALETGGVPLEETLALWERGEALAKVCQERLDGARARLERAQPTADDDG